MYPHKFLTTMLLPAYVATYGALQAGEQHADEAVAIAGGRIPCNHTRRGIMQREDEACLWRCMHQRAYGSSCTLPDAGSHRHRAYAGMSAASGMHSLGVCEVFAHQAARGSCACGPDDMRRARAGRVASKRRMGKLVFYDIKADGEKVQAMAAADNSPLDEASFITLHNRRAPCLAACGRFRREGRSLKACHTSMCVGAPCQCHWCHTMPPRSCLGGHTRLGRVVAHWETAVSSSLQRGSGENYSAAMCEALVKHLPRARPVKPRGAVLG